MKVAYLSDTHFEHHQMTVKEFVLKLDPQPADVLIISGDIANHNDAAVRLVEHLLKLYPHVLLTYGNHDMYGLIPYRERIADLKQRVEELGAVLLDGETVTIDGVTFGGLPFWYYLRPEEIQEFYSWSDRHITGFNTQLFFQEQYEKLSHMRNVDVLFSHVVAIKVPHKYRPHRYRHSITNKFFMGDYLEELLATGAKYYIYGHTHHKVSYTFSGIQMMCNPIGYPFEGFNNKIEYFNIKEKR